MQISSLSSVSTTTAQTQSAAQAETLAAVASDTVSGKNYAISVDGSGGTYEASVPNLPGASASGSSVQAAENNLDAILDVLA
ncbi:MAG TPA: hypothetical protein VHX63_09490 [Acidobacteriaceae bacterium]|nr:hypothetical protein [Acidobacteriaceae bacterium]